MSIFLLHLLGSKFGSVPTNFTMNNVGCMGNETELAECSFLPTHDCKGKEGAGVRCQGNYLNK